MNSVMKKILWSIVGICTTTTLIYLNLSKFTIFDECESQNPDVSGYLHYNPGDHSFYNSCFTYKYFRGDLVILMQVLLIVSLVSFVNICPPKKNIHLEVDLKKIENDGNQEGAEIIDKNNFKTGNTLFTAAV